VIDEPRVASTVIVADGLIITVVVTVIFATGAAVTDEVNDVVEPCTDCTALTRAATSFPLVCAAAAVALSVAETSTSTVPAARRRSPRRRPPTTVHTTADSGTLFCWATAFLQSASEIAGLNE